MIQTQKAFFWGPSDSYKNPWPHPFKNYLPNLFNLFAVVSYKQPNAPDTSSQGRFYVGAGGAQAPQIFWFQQQKYAFLKSRLFLYSGEINTRIS